MMKKTEKRVLWISFPLLLSLAYAFLITSQNTFSEGDAEARHPASGYLAVNVDLGGDGIELIALADSKVQFNLDLDEFAERTGWVAANDALLAYDINGNGVIDDQSELFGNSDAFENGFQSLAALDSNSDRIIDQNDAAYANLVLWKDADSDGNTDAGELTSLLDAGLVRIDLGAVSVNEANLGHMVSERSTVTWGDGHSSVIEDIWFEVDQRMSDYILPENFTYSAEARILPVLYGYGHIPSTWVALSQNASLIAESKALVQQVNNGDIIGFETSFEQYMLNWAGVADVDPASRGGHIDARHLEFLEKLYGSDFLQPAPGSNPGSPNPNAPASAKLEAQFDGLVQKFAARFMVQAPNAAIVLSVLETGVAPAGPSAVDFLSFFANSLSPETGWISGSAIDAFTGIIDAYDSGALSLDSANKIIDLLRLDLDDGAGSYVNAFHAAVAVSDNLASAMDLNLFNEKINLIGGMDSADTIVGTGAN